MQDARQQARLKTYIGARIEQPYPLGTMNCIVRDLSTGGARIAFHNTASVVNRFTLVMPCKGRRVAARVVWRNFGEAGVAFEEGGGRAGHA
ncbi:MAG TPA: PilZ domain-containing protein [Beijerinckiaceae bacterium]|nr:PilZ domain-containing protein [Beijerinckiaceae bacterium]